MVSNYITTTMLLFIPLLSSVSHLWIPSGLIGVDVLADDRDDVEYTSYNRYMDAHDHPEEPVFGLGRLIVSVGGSVLHTRHNDYELQQRLPNGTIVPITTMFDNSQPISTLTFRSKAKPYLIYFETAWLNASDEYEDNVPSASRHYVPTTNMTELQLLMDLSLYGGPKSEELPNVPVVDGYYLSYNILAVPLSDPQLTSTGNGMFKLDNIDDIMATVPGRSGSHMNPPSSAILSADSSNYSSGSHPNAFFLDANRQTYAAPTNDTSVKGRGPNNERWTAAIPLEVVYVHGLYGYNPCNGTTLPYPLPSGYIEETYDFSCDHALPGGHRMFVKGDQYRYPLMKPAFKKESVHDSIVTPDQLFYMTISIYVIILLLSIVVVRKASPYQRLTSFL